MVGETQQFNQGPECLKLEANMLTTGAIGGWEAWLVVSGGFACLFCSFGWINGSSCSRMSTLYATLLNKQPSVFSKRTTRLVLYRATPQVPLHGYRH